MSVNAAKWAGVAKESVFKFSKTAATKAGELSTKVTEQAKDGSLMTNVQSGVTNMASTMGKLGTKTWSDMQSLWSGKDNHLTNSAHSEAANNQNQSDSVSFTHRKSAGTVANKCVRLLGMPYLLSCQHSHRTESSSIYRMNGLHTNKHLLGWTEMPEIRRRRLIFLRALSNNNRNRTVIPTFSPGSTMRPLVTHGLLSRTNQHIPRHLPRQQI